jgi:ubiquinone/menaquinone biosynthesis C-methylase UbiE
MTERRRTHPIFARFYARVSPGMDREGMADYRARLLSGLTGTVVEVGCGNGRNFMHYPSSVTRVLAVEPDPYLRALAERAAAQSQVPIDVVNAVAEHLPASEGTFDAAVTCLVLCSVPEQHAALRELHRVLKPGGELRFLEHVRAATPGFARFQRAMDATVWPLLAGGCRTGRDTETSISQAGFTLKQIAHFDFPEAGRLRPPAAPHILGTAVRAV